MSTYEEWRVTGTLQSGRPYDSQYPDESTARDLIDRATAVRSFADGPHLHKRTVTVTGWTEVDA